MANYLPAPIAQELAAAFPYVVRHGHLTQTAEASANEPFMHAAAHHS